MSVEKGITQDGCPRMVKKVTASSATRSGYLFLYSPITETTRISVFKTTLKIS